jgi:hypothetical protein
MSRNIGLVILIVLWVLVSAGCEGRPTSLHDLEFDVVWSSNEKAIYDFSREDGITGQTLITVEPDDQGYRVAIDYQLPAGEISSGTVLNQDLLPQSSWYSHGNLTIHGEYTKGNLSIRHIQGDNDSTTEAKLSGHPIDYVSSMYLFRNIPFTKEFQATLWLALSSSIRCYTPS